MLTNYVRAARARPRARTGSSFFSRARSFKGSCSNQNHANPNSMKGHNSILRGGDSNECLSELIVFLNVFLRVGHGRE